MSTTLHVIAPFHSRVLAENSSCAFAAGNVLPFPKMMHAVGDFRVVEYHAWSKSDSEADEHVSCLSEQEWTDHFGDTEGKGISPDISCHGAQLFNTKLLHELNKRVAQGDIVLHSYGDTSRWVINPLVLKVRHVEMAIGYDRPPFEAKRIFPSQAWRHFHFGKYSHTVEQMLDSAVIPHYFDPENWPFREKGGDYPYVLFAGRITRSKYGCLPRLVRQFSNLKFKLAGTPWGDDGKVFEGLPNVELLGSLKGKERAAVYANAACLICPTEFVEPFGAVAIEAAMCGTPVVASNYGAYAETVGGNKLGQLTRDENGWGDAIHLAMTMDRAAVAASARLHYSLDVVGKQYARFFERLPNP